MEVKPRTKNAVLLSVGVLEFLTLQILNGTVKFSVDNGAGVESVIYTPPPSTSSICDGHWHRISVGRVFLCFLNREVVFFLITAHPFLNDWERYFG
jgi:hypothetical protein